MRPAQGQVRPQRVEERREGGQERQQLLQVLLVGPAVQHEAVKVV